MASTPKRAPARRRTQPAAVTVKTPKPKEEKTYPFKLGGVVYQAHMPKDFVWMELFAATAAGASFAQKANANSSFLQACLTERDRERILARMRKPPSEDPVRGMELIACITELVKLWQPLVEAEFTTALDRSGIEYGDDDGEAA